MPICPVCGEYIPEGASYCAECGCDYSDEED
ncbi:zinc-ribbon domain-containing protein [Methanobrevibacter sp.]